MKSRAMRIRSGLILIFSGLLLVCSWCISPSALAVTQLQLSDLSYTECPPEIAQGTVTSGGPTMKAANCFLITGKAENKSNKPVVDADVYGFIYDANHNSVMENRGRLGSISEVPPGVSSFELRISVPEGLETPLQLERFKASGFTGRVSTGNGL